jgi:predicted dehydrogenase
MKDQINVGVAGCGLWGPELISHFGQLEGCVLKVACDLDLDRLASVQALHPGVECETRFDRMLERPDIDAVVVATPADQHFPMARASLLAGKHTLVEMPMASSASQCEELVEIARLRGLVLMVGHTFLFSEPVQKLREIVDSQDIGNIRYIAAQRLAMGVPQEGINAAWDLAAHDISIILHLMQELPHNVVCRGAADVAAGAAGTRSTVLHFSRNRQAFIRTSWHDSRNVRDMTIIGSRRMLVYDDISVREKIKIFGAATGGSRAPDLGAPKESLFSYSCGEIQLPGIRKDEPLKTECQHFLHCIRTGAVPLSGGTEGMEVVQVLEASAESHRLGGAPVLLSAAGSRLGCPSPATVTSEIHGGSLPVPIGA